MNSASRPQTLIQEDHLADTSANDSFHDSLDHENIQEHIDFGGNINNHLDIFNNQQNPTPEPILSNLQPLSQTSTTTPDPYNRPTANDPTQIHTHNNPNLPRQSSNSSLTDPNQDKMAEHLLNIALNHARAYLNLFTRSGIDKWFDNSVALFTAAKVPEGTYLFDIINVCNSHLPSDRHIEWNNDVKTADIKQKVIQSFQISHEEKVRKAMDQESWKNKTFKTQLNELTDAFGENYDLKKEFLIKRFPVHIQTMAFTKIQQLEATQGLSSADKLLQLVTYIDEYNLTYPSAGSSTSGNICTIQDTYINDPVITQAAQLAQIEAQKQDIVNSITEKVINSIQAMQLDNKKSEDMSKNKSWNNSNFGRNGGNKNRRYEQNHQNNNFEQNYGQNYGNRYNGSGNNGHGYNNSGNYGRYYDNGYQQQNNQKFHQQTNRKQSGRFQDIKNERPPNICADHLAYGPNYKSNKCQAGCRFHPARLCYGHANYGDRAWDSKCEPFCQRFQGQKN